MQISLCLHELGLGSAAKKIAASKQTTFTKAENANSLQKIYMNF